MESTLWCLERWWLANKGPETMTSCWMLAATRSWGLNVHSMATQNQSWDNVEACDLQCQISPPTAFMSELPKIYGNEHSFFLPGANYATSQLVELDHSSIERECPLSCLRILWVKLGTSLQGEHPNVIQMKRQAVKPSTRLVREECSDFLAAPILYQSCPFDPFARRRSHRWSS